MAQFWTEDPTIGNALAGLATSFDVNRQEDMRKKRREREAKERYGQASADFYETQKPRDLGVSLPPEWGGSINLDVPTYQWTNPNDYAARQTALANATVDLGAQTTMKNAQEAAAVQALNQVQQSGVPQTATGQTVMQTQLTGQLPMLDAKGTINNYSVQNDQTGEIVARGQTRDGRTDTTTGSPLVVPPGHSVLKTGELPADQSPYKDNGAQLRALQALNEAAAKRQLTQTELERGHILFNSQYKLIQKLEKDDAGNFRPVMIRETQPPSSFGPLMGQLGLGTPPGAPAPPAATPPPAPVAPPTTTGGPAVTAAPPPAAPGPGGPAAAAAPPIVPPPQGSAGVTVGAPVIQGSGDTQLKEVLNHPTVKGAIDATRAYDEMTRARQANTPEAALHMIYMLAKIYDPNSVVREGEVATAQNTSPAFEKIWGIYNKQKEAQSPLSERAKESFLQEGYKAASSHYDAAKGLIDFAGERATRLGLDPKNVMPPLNAPTPPAKQEPAKGARAAPTPSRPAEVQPADREALAWANQNPNDPRAKEIKRRLGM